MTGFHGPGWKNDSIPTVRVPHFCNWLKSCRKFNKSIKRSHLQIVRHSPEGAVSGAGSCPEQYNRRSELAAKRLASAPERWKPAGYRILKGTASVVASTSALVELATECIASNTTLDCVKCLLNVGRDATTTYVRVEL